MSGPRIRLGLSPLLSTGPVCNAVSIALASAFELFCFQTLTVRSLSATTVQDESVAKTRSAWVLRLLPASHQVADLILVPSSG